MKDSLYKELYELLDRLIKVYRLLLETVRKEKEQLIEVNIDELNEINKTKEQSLRKLRTLETERVRIVRALAEELKIQQDEPIRLLDIAGRYAEDDRGEKLRQKHSVLELLVKRVIENNKNNESLAQSALKNVQGAMGAIKETYEEKPTYKRQGEVKSTTSSTAGRLVSREA